MKCLRRNERQRGRPEHIVCVKGLGTYIFIQ